MSGKKKQLPVFVKSTIGKFHFNGNELLLCSISGSRPYVVWYRSKNNGDCYCEFKTKTLESASKEFVARISKETGVI